MTPDLSRSLLTSQPRSHLYRGRAVCTLLLVLCLTEIAMAGSTDPLRYTGGIRNSVDKAKLNPRQLNLVLKGLKVKSGFEELHFDADGFLRTGDPTKFSGGSASARALLLAAVSSTQLVELESLNRSPEIAFARLSSVSIYESRATGKRIVVQPLQIDFSDFEYLRGSSEAVSSFDLGFAVLHELVHAVLNLHDSTYEGDDLGDCEQYINTVRRELGLPERQAYLATVRDALQAPTGMSTKVAELQFARTLERGGKTRTERYYLNWEANKVGRLSRPTAAPTALRMAGSTVTIAQ